MTKLISFLIFSDRNRQFTRFRPIREQVSTMIINSSPENDSHRRNNFITYQNQIFSETNIEHSTQKFLRLYNRYRFQLQTIKRFFSPSGRHKLLRDSLNINSASNFSTYGTHENENIPPYPYNQIGRGNDEPEQFDIIKKPKEKEFNITFRSARSFKKNRIIEQIYEVKFSKKIQGMQISQIEETIQDVFSDLLKTAKRESSSLNDLGRLYITHKELFNPLTYKLRPIKEFTINGILNEFNRVIQSAESLTVDSSFLIHLGIAKIDQVAGGLGTPIINLDLNNPQNSLLSKKSVILIKNNDNLCMARALIICEFKLQIKLAKNELEKNIAEKKYQKVRKQNHNSLLTKEATNLHKKVGLKISQPASLSDVNKFENILNRNIVILASNLCNNKLYEGCDNYEYTLFIYQIKNTKGPDHMASVVSVSAFLGFRHYCYKCNITYNNKHSCTVKCDTCKRTGTCIEKEDALKCYDCNLFCRSKECYKAHKSSSINTGLSECDKVWFCPSCKILINRRKYDISKHDCGQWECKTCHQIQNTDSNHLCHIRSGKVKKNCDRFCFFDIETCQETGIHKPILICIQTTCEYCVHDSLLHKINCENCGYRCLKCREWNSKENKFKKSSCYKNQCGKREFYFLGENCIKLFCNWLIHKSHKDFTTIAHNGKGFDFYLILQALIEKSITPKIIFQGAKIMYIVISKNLNIRFIDSLNFCQFGLDKFEKTFGLKNKMKGFFPYLFVKSSNINYIGKLPSVDYFNVNEMSTNRRNDFLLWYEKNKNETFNLKEDMIKYCKNDVSILKEGCLTFRNLMLQITSETGDCIDIFQYVTLPSACQNIYFLKFMPEIHEITTKNKNNELQTLTVLIKDNKIINSENNNIINSKDIITRKFLFSPLGEIPPNNGYSKIGGGNYSKKSIQWLEWIMYENKNLKIQHALNKGEKKIPNEKGTGFYHLDGYDPNLKQAFEFHGCVIHLDTNPNCPYLQKNKCKNSNINSIKHPYNKKTPDQIHKEMEIRQKYIESLGIKYSCIWEHEFDYQYDNNIKMREFINSLDIQTRLAPRDAFFGGRTGGIWSFYKIKQNEKILYYDINSLYPFSYGTKNFPISHPDIITSNFKNINEYFGLAKIKVLPPDDLFFGILPVKINDKLLFPLCINCAKKETKKICICEDNKKCFIGTWATPEIQMAIEYGYKIIKIYEVYHWPKERQSYFNQYIKKKGLFTEYVNTFLKIKTESSGYPDHIKSDIEKKNYIQDFYNSQGILLDTTKIQHNPGLRAVSKLCLNSLWGRFNMLEDKTSSSLISTDNEFYKIITDPRKKLSDFHIISEDIAHLEWKHRQDLLDFNGKKTNIFVGIFTTSYARLLLLDTLLKLGDRVLYFDTDSVFFIYNENMHEYLPNLSDELGGWTDELSCSKLNCKKKNCQGHYITQMVIAGSKNYAYEIFEGDTHCKIRGFTLHYSNSQILNLDTMKSLICDNIPNKKIETTSRKITRNKENFELKNKNETKIYQTVLNKRVFLDYNKPSFPYGYRR